MFHQVNILSIYSNHLWSKNITISTACLSTHWTAHIKCITSNKLLSCFILLKTRPFSHFAHVVWFACLKWFKIKWVQTIHLHGVSSCIYTNRHGSHVSIFSKTSESKYPSTWSFFMRFIPIWLKWQCHKYVVLSLLFYIFLHEHVYHYDRDSINHSF